MIRSNRMKVIWNWSWIRTGFREKD